MAADDAVKNIDKLKATFTNVKAEIAKKIIGQEEVIEQILISILTDSNALLESYPGLGKTTMIKSIAETMNLKFSRVQGTPDLMPSDVTGTYVIEEKEGKKVFKFQRGPVFANIVLMDEINRATPKTQAALLEAMQEKQVTVGNQTFELDKPFFVLATQNPIDQEGSLELDQPVFMDGQLLTGHQLLDRAGYCIMEDDRGVRLYDIDARTATLTKDGKLDWQECYLYTLPYDGDFVRVRTQTGRTITVTENHPFLVNEDGQMIWKRADRLTEEDYLVAPAVLPEMHVEPILTHGEANRLVGGTLPAIPFDEDFAFWIGFVLSDGSIMAKCVEACQKNHPAALDRFISISERWGLRVSVTERKGCRYACIHSRPLVEYLRKRYGLRTGKEKRIPSWFLSWPKPLLKEFLHAFVGLESCLRDQRITFTQKRKRDMNLVSYMLLRFGINSHVRHDGRIFRMKLQGEDAVKYVNEIGWIVPQSHIPADKQCTSSFRSVPVDRQALMRIVGLLGLDSFHTLEGHGGISSRDWYNSYRGVRDGERVMARDSFASFVKDMRDELSYRQSAEFKGFLSGDPRRFAAGIGEPLTKVSDGIGVSKNQVWQLYADGTCAYVDQVTEYLSQRYEQRMDEAEKIVAGLEQLRDGDVCFERIRSVRTVAGDGMAFGLTVPEHHNYLAGFGACGINHNTYPLPEAQTDRFLLKILVDYPSPEDELAIVDRYTKPQDETKLKSLLSSESIVLLQKLARQVPIANDIKKRAVDIVNKTRNVPDLIEYGASPRASLGIVLAAKARALMDGRKFVSAKDIDAVAYPVLRHRIVLSFQAERAGKTPDDVIKEILT